MGSIGSGSGLHPARQYDVLCQARHKLFEWVRQLTSEQYTHVFPFGHKTVRATLVHMASAEWYFTNKWLGERRVGEIPFTEDRYPDFASLEQVWRTQEPQTRAALESVEDWDRSFEEITRGPGGGPSRVVYSAAVTAAQVCHHEVHHRSQVMAMLKQMGQPAENLDYFMFGSRWTAMDGT